MHPQESSIHISAGLVCLVLISVLGYFAFIVLRLQRKYYELKEKALELEVDLLQKERIRISTDLHDELGPLLTLVLSQIGVIKNGNEPLHHLKRAENSLITVLTRMGDIARDLNDARIIANELKTSIQAFLQQYAFKRDIRFDFRYEMASPIPGTITIQVYRMIQEMVTNTIKHANARRVQIWFKESKNIMYIYYTDDGEQPVQLKDTGLGIKNISNRTRQLNGRLKIESSRGLSFFFEIPLPTKNM